MILTPESLPIEEYHASAPAWLSKTTIRQFQDMGPAWWKLVHLDHLVKAPIPSGAEQGLALDCYLTEGVGAFREKYAIKPEGLKLNTKAGMEWAAKNEGTIHISASDYLILCDAVDAVRASPLWPAIEKCSSQYTCRRHSDALGLGLQSRPDWLDANGGIVFDLKKTRDITRFGSQAIDLGYHLQAAIASWCLAGDGVPLEHAYLVAVEWERGARCRIYEIPQDALEDGHHRMRETAQEISRRIIARDWSDRQDEIEPLPIPDYIRRNFKVLP